ncbi:MAG: urease accessory protein UreF [Alphaproteobacteria bacterium]|jgi:urease accessory protein
MTLIADGALYILTSWLSPSFPVGAYAYSHGLEMAVEDGRIKDEASLCQWVEAILIHGSARTDAILFCAAWGAVNADNPKRLIEAAIWGDSYRGTNELALESATQGAAFIETVQECWTSTAFDRWVAVLAETDRSISYAIAVAVAAAAANIPMRAALLVYLQAISANLISAGIRIIPLGQKAGQRAQAAMQEPVIGAATDAETRSMDDIGMATPLIDWASAKHETQYTRLFRS